MTIVRRSEVVSQRSETVRREDPTGCTPLAQLWRPPRRWHLLRSSCDWQQRLGVRVSTARDVEPKLPKYFTLQGCSLCNGRRRLASQRLQVCQKHNDVDMHEERTEEEPDGCFVSADSAHCDAASRQAAYEYGVPLATWYGRKPFLHDARGEAPFFCKGVTHSATTGYR